MPRSPRMGGPSEGHRSQAHGRPLRVQDPLGPVPAESGRCQGTGKHGLWRLLHSPRCEGRVGIGLGGLRRRQQVRNRGGDLRLQREQGPCAQEARQNGVMGLVHRSGHITWLRGKVPNDVFANAGGGTPTGIRWAGHDEMSNDGGDTFRKPQEAEERRG